MSRRFMNREREYVLLFYAAFIIGAIIIALLLVLSFLLRNFGFPQLAWLLVVGLPWLIARVLSDPPLLVALIIVGLFLWACPWESLFGGEGPSNHRRGREVLDDRFPQEYRETVRQHAARRNQRKRGR
jgi:hypothetical protein